MKRAVLYIINGLVSIAGLLLMVGGIGTISSDKGRLTAVGMIVIGLSTLYHWNNFVREWLPQWRKRFVVYSLGFILVGGIVFLISWM